MSEADAQVSANPSTSRLGDLGRTVTRSLRSAADAGGATAVPSFAESLFSASLLVDGDAQGPSTGQGETESNGDGELTQRGRKSDEPAPLDSSTVARSKRARSDSPILATTDPNIASAAAAQASAIPRTPTFTSIRPEGRLLGPVPVAGSNGTSVSNGTAASAASSNIAAVQASAQSAAAPLATTPPATATASPTSAASATTTPSTLAAQTATAAAANMPGAPVQINTGTSATSQAQAASAAAAASQAAAERAAASQAQATTAAAASQTPATNSAAAGQTATAASSTTGLAANGQATMQAASAGAQAAQAGQSASMANRTTAMSTSGSGALTADPRLSVQAASQNGAVSSGGTPGSARTIGSTTAGGSSSSGGTVDVGGGGGSTTATIQSLSLSQYPKPSRSDRTGVLNWASDTPPSGKDLDHLIAEARERHAGWVTFVANPDRLDEYGDLADRLTKAGLQPIARVEDPYGDLPTSDVTDLVKELRGHGVRYFELFDGPNVASETPDDKVDVRDYADRWLAAAKAVVAGGGLPGIGALASKGDYDEHGFMRQFLSAVKDRDGAGILGQSWLALRGDRPGATASSNDTDRLADRATWFDRVSRQALGRSIPILATQDPSGPAERLGADVGSSTQASQVDAAERALRDHQRKLPAFFAASRGTLDLARP